jgi:polyisoprenoid-binding protein YceI
MSDTVLPKPGVYVIDPAHSTVAFVARHLVGSKVRGHFREFSGSVTVADPIEQSSVQAEVVATSVDTGQEMRDGHLRTGDFFEAETYPTWTLTSTAVTKNSDDDLTVIADLSIRGVTKSVEFDVEYLGTGPGMAPDSVVLGLSASATVDRRDWNVSFNGVLDTGALVVSNKVKIEIDIEAALQ